MGAEGNRKDSDYKNMHVLPESNSVKPTSGHTDMARFGEAALEATKKFLEDSKVIDQFVQNTVYCHVTNMPKFCIGVLGNQLCVDSNEGHEGFAR